MHRTSETQAVDIRGKQAVAWHYLEDRTTTEVLYGGAAGGGKSFLGCAWHIYRRTTYPGSRGLIGREVLKEIKDTTLVTFFDVCKKYGYDGGRDFKYNEQQGLIKWRNGSTTILRELEDIPSDPNFDRLGSFEITDGFIDEIGQISKKAYEIVNSRIRYKLGEFGLKPKLLGTCNPGYNWVRTTFHRDDNGLPAVLQPYQQFVRARLEDNPDPVFRKNYGEQLNKLSLYERKRLREGDWDAVPRDGMEYYYPFNPDKHVGKVKYEPGEILHISVDKNRNPYYTCIIFQIVKSVGLHKGIFIPVWEVRVLDEICMPHPYNNAKGVCDALLNPTKYPYHAHPGGAYLHGDYTILNDDDEVGRNDIDHFNMRLKGIMSANGLRISPNKSVSKRRDLFLAILEELIDVRLKMAPHCKHLIDDFMYMKEDPSGEKRDSSKLKKKVKNPITKKVEEVFGHTSDALEYGVCDQFPHYMDVKQYA